MTLLKRERGLYLRIRARYVDSPEMAGSGADLPPDPGPEQVPDQVGADRGGQPEATEARSGTIRST